MDTVPVRRQIGYTLQKTGELWRLQVQHFVAEFNAARQGLALGVGLVVMATAMMLVTLTLAVVCAVVALLYMELSLLQALAIVTGITLIIGVIAGLTAWNLIQVGFKRFSLPFGELKNNLECIRDQLMLISGISSPADSSARES